MSEDADEEIDEKLKRFLQADGLHFVFDDADLNAEPSAEPSASANSSGDSLKRWVSGVDRSQECLRAAIAVLARNRSRAREVADRDALSQAIRREWRNENEAQSDPSLLSAQCAFALAALAEAGEQLEEAAIGYYRGFDILSSQLAVEYCWHKAAGEALSDLFRRLGYDRAAESVSTELKIRIPAGQYPYEAFMAWEKIALESYSKGRYRLAKRVYRNFIKSGWGSMRTQTRLVCVLMLQERWSEARDAVESAWHEREKASVDLKGRILFQRILLKMLSESEILSDLRRLETVMDYGGIISKWDWQPLLIKTRGMLSPPQFQFMVSLSQKLNGDAEAFDRSNFAPWLQAIEANLEEKARDLLSKEEVLLDSSDKALSLAFDCNRIALELRAFGRIVLAEELIGKALSIEEKLLPDDDPRRPHRVANLASVLLMQHSFADSRHQLSEAWRLSIPHVDITTARILVYRLALAWADAEAPRLFLGQLRALLAKAPLAPRGKIAETWKPFAVLESLGDQLSQHQFNLLWNLALVLNKQDRIHELDAHELWRTAEAGCD